MTTARKFGPTRAWLLTACLFSFVALLSLICLKSLGYASCILERVGTAAAEQSPDHGFRIGSLEWDVDGYAGDGRLVPFRQLFDQHCAGKNGLDAGNCVMDLFARSFAFGAEIHDFCDRNYDPASSLALHMAGHPGHCMQRSALLATVLLSTGIPARVVQLIPLHSKGHTVVEIWDRQRGWAMLDPSIGLELGSSKGPASAVAVVAAHRWPVFWGTQPRDLPSPASLYRPGTESFFDGNVLYPEPWLYLRTGKRVSFWPYRGRYAVAGPDNSRVGPAQSFFRALAAFSVLAALLCAFVPVWAAFRKKTPVSADIPFPVSVAAER